MDHLIPDRDELKGIFQQHGLSAPLLDDGSIKLESLVLRRSSPKEGWLVTCRDLHWYRSDRLVGPWIDQRVTSVQDAHDLARALRG